MESLTCTLRAQVNISLILIIHILNSYEYVVYKTVAICYINCLIIYVMCVGDMDEK